MFVTVSDGFLPETETESNCRIIRFDSIRLRRIESNPNWDPVEPNRVEWMIFSRSRIESNPNHNFLNYSELLHRFYSNRNESNEDFLEHGRIESNPNRDFLIRFGLWLQMLRIIEFKSFFVINQSKFHQKLMYFLFCLKYI
jgi:hypothetical protein